MAKPSTPSRNDLETAVNVYTWSTLEAKNLLRCISIATDHGENVDADLQPAIGIALDGVVRLLDYVSRQFEDLDNAVSDAEVASHE
jgi:hypothetical protein